MIAKSLLLALAVVPLLAADDPLAGRIAGKPQTCIDPSAYQGPTILDARTIAYRQGAKRWWVTHPIGPCVRLRDFSTLIVEIDGGQLCRNDRFRVLEQGLSIPSAPCRFSAFTPYDKR